jgi:quinol monooxygenase YgiN
MIHVLASIRIKDGKRPAFLEIFKSNIPSVLKEKGCIAYSPAIDAPTGLPAQELNDAVVTIIEKWDSLQDLKAHLSAPHMLAYREKVKDLVAGVSLKVLTEA